MRSLSYLLCVLLLTVAMPAFARLPSARGCGAACEQPVSLRMPPTFDVGDYTPIGMPPYAVVPMNTAWVDANPTWMQWGVPILTAVLILSVALAIVFQQQARVTTRALRRKSQELEREADQRRVAQERLDMLAYFDVLTGLPNRLSFSEDFATAVAEADLEGAGLAVLFIDLDRFKTINDSLGHAQGDALIRLVGARLHACLRGQDSISRFGGDEFVITLGHVHSTAAVERVAERLLASLAGAIDVGGTAVYVTASIGIALYPDDERSMDGLLKNADTAMYHAKEQGGNRYQFYQREQTARVVERLRTDTRLRQALERDEFVLYYQPIVDLHSEKVRGVEALLRWKDPERGMVDPGTFVPLAEDTGLIVAIGEQVLARACAQVRAWQRARLGQLHLSVNVSARQFQRAVIGAVVRNALQETGLQARLLHLEITEGTLLVLSEEARECLRALKASGVRLVLDDFGTGYSSLSYLTQLPFDGLKIDRSFVQNIPDRPDEAQIAQAIIAMGHGLHLSVTAEGIETPAQFAFLRDRGCTFGQGYLLGRPMPAGTFETWLRRRNEQSLRVLSPLDLQGLDHKGT